MPQFDIFSFFSQLFWVFLGFLTFYLLICFYLLPAIAAILKIRKRKLAQVSSSADISAAIDTNFTVFTKALMDSVSIKLNSATVSSDHPGMSSNLVKSLSLLSLKTESLRDFSLAVFTRTQITFLLYT
jgi:hypothetical protein